MAKKWLYRKLFGKDMKVYKLTDFSQLESGYFGIPEPREDGRNCFMGRCHHDYGGRCI